MSSRKSASSTPQRASVNTTATPSSPASNTRASTTPTSSASKPLPATARSSAKSQSPQQIAQSIWTRYVSDTPQRVKHIDAFMAFLVAVGAIQFLYVLIVGNYPFNAFLSGFSATVGQFVLTASLRIQTDPANVGEFGGKEGGFSDERAFADFVFGSLILHFFCVNFIN